MKDRSEVIGYLSNCLQRNAHAAVGDDYSVANCALFGHWQGYLRVLGVEEWEPCGLAGCARDIAIDLIHDEALRINRGESSYVERLEYGLRRLMQFLAEEACVGCGHYRFDDDTRSYYCDDPAGPCDWFVAAEDGTTQAALDYATGKDAPLPEEMERRGTIEQWALLRAAKQAMYFVRRVEDNLTPLSIDKTRQALQGFVLTFMGCSDGLQENRKALRAFNGVGLLFRRMETEGVTRSDVRGYARTARKVLEELFEYAERYWRAG
jgi:hypothetical protein